jgi:hypothetical protein
MTTTTLNKEFSDFCAQRDAQNTIQLNVLKHTQALCEALQQNFIEHSIKSHERSLFRYFDETSVAHHESCIEKLKNGECNYSYVLDSSGRKYHKIFMCVNGNRDSIHAFIDKKTGSVLKPASLKMPAKGERYNLLSIPSREKCFENADWNGGYLYAR